MVGEERGKAGRFARGAILICSLLLLVGAVAYSRARLQRAAKSEAPESVSVVRPEKKKLDANVLATGTIRLKVGAQVRVGAQLSGIVQKLRVSVGSRVRKGDVIAEIDTLNVEARVAQADALVRQDDVDLQKARRDLERGRRLLADGLLANQQGEDLEWSAASAEAKLGKARADLRAAQVDLGYAIIRAPIAGTVASVSTQEGETVAASFTAPTFVTIVKTEALELVAVVDEVDIAGVHPGDKVSFTVEAYPTKDLSGTVERVNPTATIISGVVNYEVVIGVSGDIPFLKPDMTANVAIRIAEREALVVPNAAVHENGDEKFVYVLENGQTRKRSVRTGTRSASETEIQRGLTEQDRLVLAPSAEPKKESS